MARTSQMKAAIKRAEVARGIRWTMPAGVTVKRIYGASPFVRIELVRGGVPASFVANLSQAMKVSRERIYQTMGLPRATVDRKVREEQSLNADESERVLGLVQLIGQAQAIVNESGGPEDFDAAAWVGHWLSEPHPVLGGRTPGELMDTAEGRSLVGDLMLQQQSSAYG
jgi:putative toxin-antitoxin system antitoxin component (TIGR02293 family)